MLAIVGLLPPALNASAQTPSPDTVVRIEVPAEAVSRGQEVETRVLVDNVEHLGAFQFDIQYDPEQVRFERSEEMGAFLASGPREMICGGSPYLDTKSVSVACFTAAAARSLGGPPGVSGSGVLGKLIFTALGSGEARLEFTKTLLVSDDIEPPGNPQGTPVTILHTVEDAVVPLAPAGGGFPWLIVLIVLVVVAVVAGGGLAGYWSYRRRPPPAAPPSPD